MTTTTLESDATTTSSDLRSSGPLDQMFAGQWRNSIGPGRLFRTDAETRSAPEFSARTSTALTIATAAMVIDLLARDHSGPTLHARQSLRRSPEHRSPDVDRIVAPAREELAAVKKAENHRRATELVKRLETELGRLDDLSGLPLLQATAAEDDAFLVEWTIGQRRVGLSLEDRAADSSWYYVSLEPEARSSASGAMPDLDLPMLLSKLLRR